MVSRGLDHICGYDLLTGLFLITFSILLLALGLNTLKIARLEGITN